jgi:ABC-type Fe3+-hydroxamate transport system substrate-binding protein
MVLKRVYKDQMNRQVEISCPPKRIVSLVPSQTELLYDLGLTDEVVGQTLFCVHPASMHDHKPRIGGTKKPSIEKILALQPDLIIGNKEENDKETIELLAKHCPLWMSDIHHLDDAIDMISLIGTLLNRETKAEEIVFNINQSFQQLTHKKRDSAILKTAYLIWRNPWMAAGQDTFINDMLNRNGLKNVFELETSRYPAISNEQLSSAQPELILLSSEPFPFQQKHITELSELCPKAKILLVDGELFSWYGSRLLYSADYFTQLKAAIIKY